MVASIVDIPQSSVRPHPISLIVLVVAHLVEAVSTVGISQLIVLCHPFSSTIAPASMMEVDFFNSTSMRVMIFLAVPAAHSSTAVIREARLVVAECYLILIQYRV